MWFYSGWCFRFRRGKHIFTDGSFHDRALFQFKDNGIHISLDEGFIANMRFVADIHVSIHFSVYNEVGCVNMPFNAGSFAHYQFAGRFYITLYVSVNPS